MLRFRDGAEHGGIVCVSAETIHTLRAMTLEKGTQIVMVAVDGNFLESRLKRETNT